MAIRQHIDYDGTNNRHIDLGNDTGNNSFAASKEWFVLMTVAINESWKLSIVFFF